KDLQRMEVWAAVNEADVARIFPGQRVRFTVDALPGEEFEGVVSKVRLNAQMMQNVVTYTVEVQTGNAGGRLLPYLTANLKFETSNVQSVLLVPNAALRWVPPDELLGPEGIKRNGGGKDTDELSRDAAAVPGSSPEREKGRVWVRAGRYVSAIPVSVIGSDGVNSAVESTALSEGDEVVLRLVENQDAGSAPAGASPFAPAFRRGKR
ncbi:MAG TPA: efflux RND transporter periplasmic adaptor subunit, partial [Oligoflexia bacterium]|nr:efflux RND transporter periplasmic adaptor subunit [Oligoflexia bacterium]